jgi:gamma-glutamylcysteine synthetase
MVCQSPIVIELGSVAILSLVVLQVANHEARIHIRARCWRQRDQQASWSIDLYLTDDWGFIEHKIKHPTNIETRHTNTQQQFNNLTHNHNNTSTHQHNNNKHKHTTTPAMFCVSL